MTLHHKKHHQTYVNGLNAAEEAYGKAASTAEQISLQSALKFNGGGMEMTNWGEISSRLPQVTSIIHCFGRIWPPPKPKGAS